jgi:alcohol-forming fatty acyl-CoA reductase
MSIYRYKADNNNLLIPGKDFLQVREYYSGKTILLTGSSGYIGKVILWKLLTACTDIKRIYVLIRKKEGVTL